MALDPSPDDFPPLLSLARPGRPRAKLLVLPCSPIADQSAESLTSPLSIPTSPNTDQSAAWAFTLGAVPSPVEHGAASVPAAPSSPWASRKRWADVVRKPGQPAPAGPPPAGPHGAPAERSGSRDTGSSVAEGHETWCEAPGATALPCLSHAPESHVPHGPREGAGIRVAVKSDLAHGLEGGRRPAEGVGEEGWALPRGTGEGPSTSSSTHGQALPEADPHGAKPADPRLQRHHSGSAAASASASASCELAPDKGPDQSAARGKLSPGVPDLLASAKEILGHSPGPWPCRPVARRLFALPGATRTVSLPSTSHEGGRGPPGPSLSGRTCTAGASLAVEARALAEGGRGRAWHDVGADTVEEEGNGGSEASEEEDSKAASSTPALSPEPSSSHSPAPLAPSPPPILSTLQAEEETQVLPSAEEPETLALPEGQWPGTCTPEASRGSKADPSAAGGPPQQEQHPVPPLPQSPPGARAEQLTPPPPVPLATPPASLGPGSPGSAGLPPLPSTPPATGLGAPGGPTVIIRDRPWRKICSWRSLEASSSSSSSVGNPWSLSSSSCSSGTSSPMPRGSPVPRASPGAPGCLRHRSLPPLVASRMGARGWPALHDSPSRSWKESTPVRPKPESPYALPRRLRHASPGRLSHPGSGGAVSADHTEYADVSRWLWAIPDPHKAEDPTQPMVSVAAFASFQQDQAPLYHGQQSYSDATQYGACVLALDPLLLIRLALQQQIEYYFSVANLCKDIFLRKQMDAQGFVHVSVISQFNRVRCFCVNQKFLLEVLETSRVVEVQGEHLRRRQAWEEWLLPLPSSAASVSETATSFQGEADSCEEALLEQRHELEPAVVNEPRQGS